MGNMETAQASTNEYFPFNAVIVLRLKNGPSAQMLRATFSALQRRHPLLTVHIRREKGRYFFVSDGISEIPLKEVARLSSRHWQQVVEEELNRKFDVSTGPLVRCFYLTGPDSKEESELILSFQHAIMDAASAASLLPEILSLCREVEPLPLLPPVQDLFPPAFKGLRRKWKSLSFFRRQLGDEFRYQLGTRGRRKAPIHPSGQCKILPLKLASGTTAALGKGCRKKRVTLNSLLTAAMLMAVHRHLYDGLPLPLRHIHMADLRPYLTPPLEALHLGSYFSMMRFTVGLEENPAVWELAAKVNDTTYAALKRGDKFCANLFSARLMGMLFRFKAFRMAATAMSFTGPVTLARNYGNTEVQEIHAFVSNFVLGPEYTAQVRLFNGRLCWDILYLDSDMDAKQAGIIADEIFTILESAVEE